MDQMLPILLALVTFGFAIPGQAQTLKSGVSDPAGLFSSEAVARANRTLRSVERETGWQVRIETVAALDGEAIRDRAIANAKALGIHGLYILIDKGDHLVWVAPSHSAEAAFPGSETKAIADLIKTAFRAREFDQGLLQAVQRISEDASRSPARVHRTAEATGEQEIRAPVRTLPPRVESAEEKDNRVPKATPKPHLFSLLFVGLGVLVFLWLIGRLFRHTTRGAVPPASAPSGPGYPAPGQGPGVPLDPRAVPGYGQAPRPYPPGGPAPSYGPPAYPAGPGYAVPPAAPPQGGGFVSGALGGLGGAVLGNILYDKFGRPHPGPEIPQGGAASVPPVLPGQEGSALPPTESTSTRPEPPAETYDPNAGAGGDWGAAESETAPSPTQQEWSGGDSGGEWSGADESPAGGEDWSGGAASTDSGDAGAGGDWGGGDEPSAGDEDGGAGGDWGDPGTSPDENQGSW